MASFGYRTSIWEGLETRLDGCCVTIDVHRRDWTAGALIDVSDTLESVNVSDYIQELLTEQMRPYLEA